MTSTYFTMADRDLMRLPALLNNGPQHAGGNSGLGENAISSLAGQQAMANRLAYSPPADTAVPNVASQQATCNKLAYSPATAPAISNPATDPPTSTGQAGSAHKYSHSFSSTASSAPTTNSSSHSRNSSYSTNPESPPLTAIHDYSIIAEPCVFNKLSSNSKMADMVDQNGGLGARDRDRDRDRDIDPRLPNTEQRTIVNRPIDLTLDDRAESPTDAVMPMRRRTAAGALESSSPLHDEAVAVQHGPAPRSTDSPASKNQAAPADGQSALVSAQAQGPIFPATAAYNPAGAAPPFRLEPPLVEMALASNLYKSPEQMMLDIDITLPRECKAIEECDIATGKPVGDVNWRKTMSHIFGRNKNCTRSIPENVWMWMCRKHYQRSRYRNAHEFNKSLGRMVQIQILRLVVWSNRNEDWGTPQDGVIVSWTLVARRREQMRLDDEDRKRKESADEGSPDGVSEPSSPTSPESGVVPQWLLDERGTNKSTVEIMNIVMRISRELDQNVLTLFPDIEILPNITGERAKPKTNRAKTRKLPAKPAPRTAPAPAPRAQPAPAPRLTLHDNAGYHETKRPHYNPEAQPHHNNLPFHPSPRDRLAAARQEYGMAPSLPNPYTTRDGFLDPRVPYPDARTAYPSGGGGGHSRSYSLDSHPASFQPYPEPSTSNNNNNAYQPQQGYQPQGYQPHPQQGYQQQPPQQGYTPATAGGPAFAAASQLGQNGFYDAAYWDGQQRQQQQQQAVAYAQAQQQQHHQRGDHPYYQGPAQGQQHGGSGTSRHARHLSMPAPRGDALRRAGAQGEGGAPVPVTRPGLWYGGLPPPGGGAGSAGRA